MKKSELIQKNEKSQKEITICSYTPEINNLSGSFIHLSTNATYDLDHKLPRVEGETMTREFFTDARTECGEIRTLIETGIKGHLIHEVIIDKKVLDKLKENSIYDSVIRTIINEIEFFLSRYLESYQIRVYFSNKFSSDGNIFVRIILNNKSFGKMIDLWDDISDIIFNNIESLVDKRESEYLKKLIIAEMRSLEDGVQSK